MASHDLPRTARRRGVVPKATGKHAFGSRRKPHMTERGAYARGFSSHADLRSKVNVHCGPSAVGSQSTAVGARKQFVRLPATRRGA